MVLNLVREKRVVPQLRNRALYGSVAIVVRRVHGFVNRIVQHDAERIRNVGQKAKSRDSDSVWLRVVQEIHRDGLRRKCKSE